MFRNRLLLISLCQAPIVDPCARDFYAAKHPAKGVIALCGRFNGKYIKGGGFRLPKTLAEAFSL